MAWNFNWLDKPLFDLGVKPFLLAELFKLSILSVIITLLNDKLSILREWK